ncbi:MAG: hypothetical protein LBR08_06020 [Bacteroidales bacterium]|nr:hypothetical protein [Bacteroidales bacterium]
MRIKFILFLLAFLPFVLAAQSDSATNKIRYTPDFKFRDGIYLNFNQVKSNKPIPKSRVLTSVEYNSNTFFDQITAEDKFTYFDDLGNSQEVNVKSIWGYCKNGILYIGIGGAFNRITIVGSICHFVANITSYNNRYDSYGPYGYYPYNYYSPYGYGYPPYSYSPGYRTTELKQFLLDFNTGKVVEYDNKNVEMLLMSDPELHDEYAGLRSKKKQQLRFMYIRKFNEKHPLFIPK